jgi:hypothetical protein
MVGGLRDHIGARSAVKNQSTGSRGSLSEAALSTKNEFSIPEIAQR